MSRRNKSKSHLKVKPAKTPPHARRDEVRTQSVTVRPTDRPRTMNQATTLRVTSETRTQRTFTKTVQGRRYDNGMTLWPAATVRVNWQKPYFPRAHAYYPQRNYVSPFGFYFGIVPAFISRDYGYDRRLDHGYMEMITYNGKNFRGYTDTQDTKV